jgi:uncharacterized RDD family membrane protein YckC
MTAQRIQVTGNYGGSVTRFLAHTLDGAIAGALFIAASAAFRYVVESVIGVETPTPRGPWGGLALLLWLFLYWWLTVAVAGKTPGKGILGLRILAHDGEPLGAGRSALRALALPLSYAVFGLGFFGVVLGKERRALHDVIAGSVVVYDWGDRPAELPTPISSFVARRAGAEYAGPAQD